MKKICNRCTLSSVQLFGIIVLFSSCITLQSLWCQPNSLRAVLENIWYQPLLILLNIVPISLLLLSLTFLFGNVFFAAALINLIIGILSIANRIKIEVREEPVFPRDLWLLKEVGSAVKSYDMELPWDCIAVILIGTLILLFLGFYVNSKLFFKFKMGWKKRILIPIVTFITLVILIVTVYSSNNLYNSFKVSNPYFVPAVFNELGFPYCFTHHFTTYLVDKPNGFDKGQAEKWEKDYLQVGSGDDEKRENINVIMVMNEAFSDLSDYEAFEFQEEPLPNLQAMRENPHAITGHVVVPGFAGDTANTEFDVLTGIQANSLSQSATSAMRVINRNIDSLFRVYGSNGYHTSFIHPGNNWFYNRENVYEWMGANETIFINQMIDPIYKGDWVTDDYTASVLEKHYFDTIMSGQNLFCYVTTIQNHMSYTEDKYGEGYIFPEIELKTDISDKEESMLKVYLEGARDADAMLGRLNNYFAKCEEPVLLVFFGDHLPYLGDHQSGYVELGMNRENHWDQLLSYETPYVIWVNDEAAKILDWEKAVNDLRLQEDVSASFLGAAILQLTGHLNGNAWFEFLNQLRQECTVVQKGTFMLGDGTITNVLDQTLEERIEQWRRWSYYKLKYQKFE